MRCTPPRFPELDGHSPFQCLSFCNLHIDYASVLTMPLMANQDRGPLDLQGFYYLKMVPVLRQLKFAPFLYFASFSARSQLLDTSKTSGPKAALGVGV